MSRARLYYYDSATAGLAEDISLIQPVPFNSTLLQISFNFVGVSVTNEDVVIRKVSAQGAIYNVEIRTFDPHAEGLNAVICSGSWEFRRGDSIQINYTNTDDRSVGVEVVFKEAD